MDDMVTGAYIFGAQNGADIWLEHTFEGGAYISKHAGHYVIVSRYAPFGAYIWAKWLISPEHTLKKSKMEHTIDWSIHLISGAYNFDLFFSNENCNFF